MADGEALLRLGSFASLFVLFAAMEYWRPFRVAPRQRWLANLGLLVIASALLRLLFPLAATGVALWAQQRGWGLMNAVDSALWWRELVGVVVLDLVIYWQHRLFHRLPWLWRLHRVHHADTAVDVSTGLRFHPLEFLLSMLIKVSVIIALGIAPLAVLVFELLLNGCAMFNHSNIALSSRWERRARRLLITPTLHRIHHSRRREESQRNYGFSVPYWDWLFGSYCARSADGDDGVVLGLPAAKQYPSRLSLLLWLPFHRDQRGTEEELQ